MSITARHRCGISFGYDHWSYGGFDGWFVVVKVLPYGVNVTLSHTELTKPPAVATVQSEECRTAAQAMIDKLASGKFQSPDIAKLFHDFGHTLKKFWFPLNQYEEKLIAVFLDTRYQAAEAK